MLFTVIINLIYEGGIYLEIFRISFHRLRCESDAGSNHFTCKSRTYKRNHTQSTFQDVDGGTPSVSRPTFEEAGLFIQDVKDNIY